MEHRLNSKLSIYICIYSVIIIYCFIYIWDFGPFKIIFKLVMSGKSIARGELPGSSALSLAESDIFIKEGEAGSLGHTAVRD